jgi:hypothetical protein
MVQKIQCLSGRNGNEITLFYRFEKKARREEVKGESQKSGQPDKLEL